VKGHVDIGSGAAKRDGRPQSAGGSAYAFRPAARQDLPLLQHWLRTPEVVRWWGNAEEQAVLLRDDMDEPRMVMRIVSFEGRPFAYAQDYAVHVWPRPHFAHLPPGSRAIDSFIGEPDMIGRGHGSTYLKLLAERLRAEGAPVGAIDPDVVNLRARQAYEKAGFRGDTVVESGEGPAILMIFDLTRESSHLL
jgi:aminoglycoside 6'-N-acetyltransferase